MLLGHLPFNLQDTVVNHEFTFNLTSRPWILDETGGCILDDFNHGCWPVKVNEAKSTVRVESDTKDLIPRGKSMWFEEETHFIFRSLIWDVTNEERGLGTT